MRSSHENTLVHWPPQLKYQNEQHQRKQDVRKQQTIAQETTGFNYEMSNHETFRMTNCGIHKRASLFTKLALQTHWLNIDRLFVNICVTKSQSPSPIYPFQLISCLLIQGRLRGGNLAVLRYGFIHPRLYNQQLNTVTFSTGKCLSYSATHLYRKMHEDKRS